MAKQKKDVRDLDLGELTSSIIQHAEQLLIQHFDLLRVEMRHELQRARDAAVSFSVGAGLAATGGVLSVVALVHLLQRLTGWPLWVCYGLAAGTFGAGGAALLRRAQAALAEVQLPPPQTTAALGEDLAWLKQQTTGAT